MAATPRRALHLRGVGPVAEALDLGRPPARARCRRPARRRAARGPSAGRSSRSTGRCRGAPGARAWTSSSSRPRQPVEVERAGLDRLGQRAAVARLLAAEPDGQQLGVGRARGSGPGVSGSAARRASRSKAACADASETCCSRMMWSERREAGLAVPQRRRPVALDDRRRGRRPAPASSATAASRPARVSGRRGRLATLPATAPRSPNPPAGSGSNGRPSAPRSHARAFSPSDGRW